MRRKKVLFIVNPRSGKGQIRNALLDIADIFIKGGLDVTLYVTQKPQDASRDQTPDRLYPGRKHKRFCKQPADPEKDDGSGTVYCREQRLSV